jgi:hypothetical protein
VQVEELQVRLAAGRNGAGFAQQLLVQAAHKISTGFQLTYNRIIQK